MTTTLKVYTLYPNGRKISTQTNNYAGASIDVLAASVRQAFAIAHNNQRADYTSPRPVGVLQEYLRGGWAGVDGWTRLACGCHNHGGLGVSHGAGIRAVRAAIAAHSLVCPA